MPRELKLFLMVILFALFALGAVRFCPSPTQASPRVPELEPMVITAQPKLVEMTLLEEPLDVEPLPFTEATYRPIFPQPEHLTLIGRLSEGIYRWKTSKEKHAYFFCGEAYEGEDAKDQAVLAAFHVVKATWDPETGKTLVNPWGVAGTAAKEGQFDVCAFGLYPRLSAYQLKRSNGKPILKPSRRSISHPRDEVIKAMRHPKLEKKYPAYDLGVLQVLDKYYEGYLYTERLKGSREDLLTWEGFYWQVRHHMYQKVVAHNTDKPWMYWPGHRSEKYHNSVVKFARRLGAREDEI